MQIIDSDYNTFKDSLEAANINEFNSEVEGETLNDCKSRIIKKQADALCWQLLSQCCSHLKWNIFRDWGKGSAKSKEKAHDPVLMNYNLCKYDSAICLSTSFNLHKLLAAAQDNNEGNEMKSTDSSDK